MEGTILKWHKQPGDKVDVDETILEISTDKVDTEVPSPEAGVVSELLYSEGDVVEVGKVIAKLNSNGSGSESEEPKEKETDKKVEIRLDEPAPEIKKEIITEGEMLDGKRLKGWLAPQQQCPNLPAACV